MEHLPDDTFTLPMTCEKHGAFESRRIIGKILSRCPKCESERRVAEQAKEAEEARRHTEALRAKRLGRAAVPERFQGRSFDTFIADTPEKMRCLSVVRDYCENFDGNARKGSGLILSGMPGTGKSHLAGAVLQAHLEKDVLYATCLDLIRMVRETWRKDSSQSERQVLSYLSGLDLLVIDEMGVQYGTDGEQTILFDVLDGRYRSMKPVILLTNQNAEGLKAFVGERTFDRLRETCRWVQFDWGSYRPQARKDAA